MLHNSSLAVCVSVAPPSPFCPPPPSIHGVAEPGFPSFGSIQLCVVVCFSPCGPWGQVRVAAGCRSPSSPSRSCVCAFQGLNLPTFTQARPHMIYTWWHMHVHTHACTSLRACTRDDSYAHTRMHALALARAHDDTYIRIHMHACVCMWAHARVHTHTHTHTCARARAHTHTHTHLN